MLSLVCILSKSFPILLHFLKFYKSLSCFLCLCNTHIFPFLPPSLPPSLPSFLAVPRGMRGSLFPDQGSNLCPLRWKRRVSTTGPPGKSLFFLFFNTQTGYTILAIPIFGYMQNCRLFRCPDVSQFISPFFHR